MALPPPPRLQIEQQIERLPPDQRARLYWLVQILRCYPDSAAAAADQSDNRLTQVLRQFFDKLGKNLG